MALEIEVLREIPVERTVETLLYRAVHLPQSGEPDPLMVVPEWGRWPTAWTLYTGSTNLVAWAEYCRNHAKDIDLADPTGGVGLNETSLEMFASLQVGDPLLRRALYELTFAFERLADLTNPWAEELLVRAGFELEDFYADKASGYGSCPELAALVGKLGWEAMRVPSAAWQRSENWCVPVFETGRRRLEGIKPLLDAARPTVALAVATTYAEGERPGWLD
jgi:hypothetical protein